MPESSQENIPINLPKGQSLEAAREGVEWLPITSDLERTDIILTLLDFKLGTTISSPDPMLTNMTAELLQGLGLSYVAGDRGEWYVAKSEADAQRLHQVFEVRKDIKEQGRMSGYPESAVENYARDMEQIKKPDITEEEVYNVLSKSSGNLKVPPEILKEDFMVFLDFKLSATNWQEELKTVKKRAEAISKFDPLLYKRIVDSYHRTR